MVETSFPVSKKTLNTDIIDKDIQYGKILLDKPIEMPGGPEDVLKSLSGQYKLVVATKGDLPDQLFFRF